MLYIIATPIGNLQDITLRALDCLKSCDYILCEDTRHSLKLLQAHGIAKPCVSFHQFNEQNRQNKVISDLQMGKEIALISDAGTPLIADPGFTLIHTCRELNLVVTALPGPCALITALTLSGFAPLPFQFIGFLPKKENELTACLEQVLEYPGTTIAYEAPNRVHKTLSALAVLDPTQKIAIARELTKKYETILTGTCEELLSHTKELLGEVVLLFQGKKDTPPPVFSQKLVQLLVNDLVEQGISAKDAVQSISQQLKIPKKIIYKSAHLALE